MGRKKIRKILTHISIILILLVILFPMLFIFVSSFKTFGELIKQGTGFFPEKPTLNNYKSCKELSFISV